MGYNRCFSCCKVLGPEGEALKCAYCRNWQHLNCAKGVSQRFFTKFYLAVMNREKPAYWECQNCAEHQSVLAPLKVPLLVPSKVCRDSNIQDEINFGFGVPLTAEVLIQPRTIIEDVSSVFPTAYCLYQEQSGAEKVVRDGHGNVFRTTWLYVDDTESYQCCHFGCQFQVQVSEKRGVFLTSKDNNTHKHSMRPIEYWSESLGSGIPLTAKTAKPSKPSQPVFTAKTAKPTKPSQQPATAKPTQPGLYRATKRPLEDCSNSSDNSNPAKIFKVEHQGTGKRTQFFLTDRQGYTYQIKYKLEGRYVGTCTEEKSCCPATVIQKQKNRFKRGTALHNHRPNQSQTSSGTNSTSKAPGDQSQTSTSQGPTSKPDVSQSKTTSKSTANKSKTSRTKGPWGPTTVPAASQSMNRPNTGPTTEPVVGQSNDGHEKPATSQQEQIPKDQTPDQEDTGDKLPLGKNLTSTKKSKPAKKVKTTSPPAKRAKSTAQAKQEAPSAPLPLYSSPANPLICQRCNKEATFQEVSTCPRYGRKEQSYLLDPEYYMYKIKIADEETQTTTWKCTHVGDDGTKCPGKVQVDYTREFNQDDNYSYDWTFDHNDHSLVRTQPHNHGPDKGTAVDLLIKAYIHLIIFGNEELFTTAADIISNAYDWLHDHESLVALPLNSRRYKRYIYTKKDEFRSNFGFYHYHYRIKKTWTDSEEEDEEEESTDDELAKEEEVEAKKEYPSVLLRHR